MILYKHKYGGVYHLINMLSTQSLRSEPFVEYVHLYPFDPQYHTRSIREFFDGRFTPITITEFISIVQSNTLEEYQQIVKQAKAAADESS